MSLRADLAAAFEWRKKAGLLDGTEVLRIYYDPATIAIDLFGEHAWITQWGNLRAGVLPDALEFLKKLSPWGKNLESVVLMDRSKVASEKDVQTLWGEAPVARFSIEEFGIPYLVQMSAGKHPGLFLDHAPLRKWLAGSQSRKRVLNLFAYTGSLSVAAARGGAEHVTTLDLSKSTIEWAESNWANAGLAVDRGRFIYGDVFEWLPKFAKKQEQYDTILCDPPSFSRSKNGVFSTSKDSQRLHELILPLLRVGGVLVTSINSENYSEQAFLGDIHSAGEKVGAVLQVLRRVDLPESFATSTRDLGERYLKGFYLVRLK